MKAYQVDVWKGDKVIESTLRIAPSAKAATEQVNAPKGSEVVATTRNLSDDESHIRNT